MIKKNLLYEILHNIAIIDRHIKNENTKQRRCYLTFNSTFYNAKFYNNFIFLHDCLFNYDYLFNFISWDGYSYILFKKNKIVSKLDKIIII